MKKTQLPPAANYDVGYRKPPSHTRFQPGQSGNPKGRPKGARNKPELKSMRLISLFREEAKRPITYLDNGRKVTTTAEAAIARRLTADALLGKPTAAKLFTAILREADRIDQKNKERLLEWATNYKANIKNTKEYREGSAVPDPDDMVIFDDGSVRCFGPFHEHHKEIQRMWQKHLASLKEQMTALETRAKNKRLGMKTKCKLLTEYSEKRRLARQLEYELRKDRDWMSDPPNILKP